MSTRTLKSKRKSISLKTKTEILNRLRNGEGPTALGKSFGLHEATVRTIKKNEASIRQSVASGTQLSAKTTSYTRDSIIEKMEKALIIWIGDNAQKNISVDGNIIRQKAIEIYKEIKERETSVLSQSSYDKGFVFSGSSGWLSGFLKRQALQNIKVMREIISGDETAAKEFLPELSTIIADGGYTPDQVFTAQEFGLFWKKIPSTYVPKSQNSSCDFKRAKDRVTFFLCSNASGDRILKPLLVNQTLKPRSMRDVDLDKLPVHWMASKKASVSPTIFTEWFNTCFVPESKRYMYKKGLKFKALLIVDCTPGYPACEHPNVKVLFLPPNTSCLIQPMNQGIISAFKTHYIKQALKFILNSMNHDNTLTLVGAWKMFSIQDCISTAAWALSELGSAALNACWKAIWPECVKDNNQVAPLISEYQSIITLAHAVGGEDFEDLSSADIDELLQDKVASEHEIVHVSVEAANSTAISFHDEPAHLTASLIKKGLQLANKLERFFVEHDPNVERVANFQRDLNACMVPYHDAYKELSKNGRQRLITEFTVKYNNVQSGQTKSALRKRKMSVVGKN